MCGEFLFFFKFWKRFRKSVEKEGKFETEYSIKILEKEISHNIAKNKKRSLGHMSRQN
jgi:hypothetical protein